MNLQAGDRHEEINSGPRKDASLVDEEVIDVGEKVSNVDEKSIKEMETKRRVEILKIKSTV